MEIHNLIRFYIGINIVLNSSSFRNYRLVIILECLETILFYQYLNFCKILNLKSRVLIGRDMCNVHNYS